MRTSENFISKITCDSNNQLEVRDMAFMIRTIRGNFIADRFNNPTCGKG